MLTEHTRQALLTHGPLTTREVAKLIGATPLQAAGCLNRLKNAKKAICIDRIYESANDRRTLVKRWQLCDDDSAETPIRREVTPFRDPEHDQWLAAVRARQQYRQQQRMEWRV